MIQTTIAAHRIPRVQPVRFEDAEDAEKAYVCRCGACVMLTISDPLPEGWRVLMPRRRQSPSTVWTLVRVAYLCPTCIPTQS